MHTLLQLTLANIRSYARDRAALFWSLGFPLIFIFLFGWIFQGGSFEVDLGFVDQDGSAASHSLQAAFAGNTAVKLRTGDEASVLDALRNGKVQGIVEVPSGYGAALSGSAPVPLTVFTDAAQSQQTGSVLQVVQGTLYALNPGGTPPKVVVTPRPVQTQDLNFISYFVPSMIGLSIMQAGLFAAIPLVADREKLILKRLAATPLRRWQLVGSNILMRLLIAVGQALVIIAVGSLVFGVQVTGNIALIGAFIVLGSVTFLALGYVIASFARTEDAANGMVSVLQFPMMFLSGTFFVISQMPGFLQPVARAIPLTYLSDALRQVMVDGSALSPLWVCAVVLAAWLVVSFGIAARFFEWQ